jgi:hypothetical protein
VEQVGEEAEQIRAALDKYGGRQALRQREAHDRAELMELAEVGRRAKAELDEEEALMGAAGRANRQLAEMYETGASILGTMAGSRERLKVCGGPSGAGGARCLAAAEPGVRHADLTLAAAGWATPHAARAPQGAGRAQQRRPGRVGAEAHRAAAEDGCLGHVRRHGGCGGSLLLLGPRCCWGPLRGRRLPLEPTLMPTPAGGGAAGDGGDDVVGVVVRL